MTFAGRTARSILQSYADHLNALLATTVTQRRVTAQATSRESVIRLQFLRQGSISHAIVGSRYGPLRLTIGQQLEVERDAGATSLVATAYRYTIARDDDSDPVFRWEAEIPERRAEVQHCRFHLQGDISVSLSRRHAAANLNDMHLPTGWVPVEEVLRFCIVDLGVAPLSEDWDARLRESMRRTKALQPGTD